MLRRSQREPSFSPCATLRVSFFFDAAAQHPADPAQTSSPSTPKKTSPNNNTQSVSQFQYSYASLVPFPLPPRFPSFSISNFIYFFASSSLTLFHPSSTGFKVIIPHHFSPSSSVLSSFHTRRFLRRFQPSTEKLLPAFRQHARLQHHPLFLVSPSLSLSFHPHIPKRDHNISSSFI